MFYDNINNDGSSFNTSFRSGNGKAFVQAYATSGMVANTPYAVKFTGSGYSATILVASIYAYVGVPERITASGCVGWVQIRGPVEGLQASAAESVGSVGHAISWEVATVFASSSANQGNGERGQIGVLTKAANASTTLNVYLTGVWATPKA
uniref:Tail protein n=1 Tax=viral metagenome TaxID=1070528 RepID=A0A6H1ZU79_9ZZZZ